MWFSFKPTDQIYVKDCEMFYLMLRILVKTKVINIAKNFLGIQKHMLQMHFTLV